MAALFDPLSKVGYESQIMRQNRPQGRSVMDLEPLPKLGESTPESRSESGSPEPVRPGIFESEKSTVRIATYDRKHMIICEVAYEIFL